MKESENIKIHEDETKERGGGRGIFFRGYDFYFNSLKSYFHSWQNAFESFL